MGTYEGVWPGLEWQSLSLCYQHNSNKSRGGRLGLVAQLEGLPRIASSISRRGLQIERSRDEDIICWPSGGTEHRQSFLILYLPIYSYKIQSGCNSESLSLIFLGNTWWVILLLRKHFLYPSNRTRRHFLAILIPLIVAAEDILQAGSNVSVDDHVEAGVDQTVEVGEDDQVGYDFNILLYPNHEDNSVGPPAQQESCSKIN